MNSAHWRAVALIYLYGVLAVASLSKVIPLAADIQGALHASPQAFGLYVALMMVPAALFAAIAGGVIDKLGARRALVFSALCGLVVNLMYLPAQSHRVASRSALKHLLDTFFQGSPEQVVGTLLGKDGSGVSREELDRIADLVERAKRESRRR